MVAVPDVHAERGRPYLFAQDMKLVVPILLVLLHFRDRLVAYLEHDVMIILCMIVLDLLTIRIQKVNVDVVRLRTNGYRNLARYHSILVGDNLLTIHLQHETFRPDVLLFSVTIDPVAARNRTGCNNKTC